MLREVKRRRHQRVNKFTHPGEPGEKFGHFYSQLENALRVECLDAVSPCTEVTLMLYSFFCSFFLFIYLFFFSFHFIVTLTLGILVQLVCSCGVYSTVSFSFCPLTVSSLSISLSLALSHTLPHTLSHTHFCVYEIAFV